MNSKRIFFGLIGVIVLLFAGLIGGAYGINALLVKQADDLTNLKAKSLALDKQKIGFAKAKTDIALYSDLEKITKAVVPEDKSQAEATREIVKIADENNIKLASITFPASTLGSGPAGAASAAAAASTTGPLNSSTGPNTDNKKSLSQLTAVKNIPGVYQLQITVSSDTTKPVKYDQFIGFLHDLEQNRRTAQVSAITITPDVLNSNYLTFNLTLNEYIKP